MSFQDGERVAWPQPFVSFYRDMIHATEYWLVVSVLNVLLSVLNISHGDLWFGLFLLATSVFWMLVAHTAWGKGND